MLSFVSLENSVYTTLGLFEPQSKKGGMQDLGHCLLSAEFLSLTAVCIYQLQKPPFFVQLQSSHVIKTLFCKWRDLWSLSLICSCSTGFSQDVAIRFGFHALDNNLHMPTNTSDCKCTVTVLKRKCALEGSPGGLVCYISPGREDTFIMQQHLIKHQEMERN